MGLAGLILARASIVCASSKGSDESKSHVLPGSCLNEMLARFYVQYFNKSYVTSF